MNIIVVGCGRVGGHLATLLSDDGHNVSVIDRTTEAFSALGRDFNGMTIKGIGFDEDVLRAAGIEECDVLASVTHNDNANLMTAEVARQIFGVKHIITRLYDPAREKMYTQLNVDFACGTTLVAEEIFAKIQAGHGYHIDTFGDFELIRFALALPKGSDSISCKRLEEEHGARVIVYEHDDETYMPKPNSTLHRGDVILVCISREDLVEFSDFIQASREQ